MESKLMTTSEPTTGEIVRSLKNCADADARKRPCTTDCYYFDKSIDCKVDLLNVVADRLESQERENSDLRETLRITCENWSASSKEKNEQIAALTARAEQAERAIEDIEYDYNHDMICNQCESGNNASCHHTAAFYGCGFKYDRRGLLPQEGE